jgi:hypothetical protein
MIVFLQLTTAGIDSGPFDLYSNLDGYSEPFEENVSRDLLVAGYSTTVPDNAITVRITSKEDCISSVDITLRDVECNLEGYTGEITTTSTSSSTTTTTSTSSSTTTTTTTVLTYSVGQAALGGIIAYILEPGDPGYDANVQHGLVVATSDIAGGAPWGCSGTTISGADGFAIGTGNQNTIDIMAGCATAGIAARLCGDLTEGGYSDWFLPSENELNKILLNSTTIGGVWNSVYWSSREGTDVYAWAQGPYLGTFYDFKYYSYAARPTRYF